MSLIKRGWSAFGKIGIVIGIAVAFLFGLTSTVYLSLRSSEVKVPDVVGKDRLSAENALQDAGLNIRVRATRPSADAKPDTVIMQLPRAGEVIKEGQTVAVDLSRVPKEGEASVSIASTENKPGENKPAENREDNNNSNAPAQNQNQNQNQSQNANQNQNQNKAKRNKNSNANAKNTNNSNNGNSAGNGNRNAGGNSNNRNQNANANRNANGGTANRNAGLNINRSSNGNNSNANRRAPATSTPPFVRPGNQRTP